jgi:hypothetical protein
MRILLLMNKDYSPYWKWLAYSFCNLNDSPEYASLLESLHGTDIISNKVDIVQTICDRIDKRILSMGIITGKGVSEYAEYLLPLLNDHDELLLKAAWISLQAW